MVAISWIALRITIKTYKNTSGCQVVSSSTPGSSPVCSPTRGQTQQANLGASSSATLHRSLLNERFYLMAAAAAAAATMAHRQAAAQATAPRAGRDQRPGLAGRLLDNTRRRLPQRLARLLGQTDYSSSRVACTSSAAEPHQPASNLAAIFHQYQAALIQANGCQPIVGPALPFVLPPAAHPGHLFGINPADIALRPPPPSYNASVQDPRLRNQQFIWTGVRPPTPPPPRPPPPSPPSVDTTSMLSSVVAQPAPSSSTLPTRPSDEVSDTTPATSADTSRPRQVVTKPQITNNDIYEPSGSTTRIHVSGLSQTKAEVLGYL